MYCIVLIVLIVLVVLYCIVLTGVAAAATTLAEQSITAQASRLSGTESRAAAAEQTASALADSLRCRGCNIIWDHYSTTSRAVSSPAPPCTRRAACSTWWPCGWNADRCLRSDVVTNSRLQGSVRPRGLCVRHQLGVARRHAVALRRRGAAPVPPVLSFLFPWPDSRRSSCGLLAVHVGVNTGARCTVFGEIFWGYVFIAHSEVIVAVVVGFRQPMVGMTTGREPPSFVYSCPRLKTDVVC